MWQRWNSSTHIFEKSSDNGGAWTPLGLSADIITEGALAKARQHAQTPYKDEANVFTDANDFSLGLKEYSRSYLQGIWQAHPHAGTDFTGNGSMTWTVSAGDMIENKYAVVGGVLLWSVVLTTFTIGGTLNTQLKILVPGGLTVAGNHYSAVAYSNGGAGNDALMVNILDSTHIMIRRKDLGAFVAGLTELYFSCALGLA